MTHESYYHMKVTKQFFQRSQSFVFLLKIICLLFTNVIKLFNFKSPKKPFDNLFPKFFLRNLSQIIFGAYFLSFESFFRIQFNFLYVTQTMVNICFKTATFFCFVSTDISVPYEGQIHLSTPPLI
jgi:hypothetical protein